MMLAVGSGLLAGCDDTLFGVPIGGGPVEPEYSVDWAGIEDMFADHCAACHPGTNAWVLADLEADIQDDAGVYVVAGDAQGSQLWRMISNTRQDTDQPVMPLGSAGLLPAAREHVRLWIEAGAPLAGE
jgi:hypothetical protein